MSIKSKIAAAVFAAVALGTTALATAGSAEAHYYHRYHHYYGYGYSSYYNYYPSCRYVAQYDSYGYYIGSVRVCDYASSGY